MNFPFGRRSSRDSENEEEQRSLGSSISEGGSRLFGSVMATKNGLFDGISSKFDQVMKIGSVDQEGPPPTPPPTKSSPVPSPPIQSPRSVTQTSPSQFMPQSPGSPQAQASAQPKASPVRPKPVRRQNSAGKFPPPKPPAPNVKVRSNINGAVRQFSAEAPPSPGSPKTKQVGGGLGRQVSLPANVAINFDEPLYDRNKPGLSGSTIPENNTAQGGSNEEAVSRNRYDFPRQSGEGTRFGGPVEVKRPGQDYSYDKFTSPSLNLEEQVGNMASLDGISISGPAGIMDKDKIMLGGDLLPGIPRVPSVPGNQAPTSSFLAPQEPKDLLAITPTSGEALPMPNIEPTYAPGEDASDAESSATEGCDEEPDRHGDFADGDLDYTGGYMFRSGSVGSDKSWSSTFSSESQLDELSAECMQFMKIFVGKIFDNSLSITQDDKARFGEMCQHGPGRLWFARYVNAQRVNNKKVDEQIFYRLVQNFAIALFECNESEDYAPAKTLMNMCFTFFYEAQQPMGPTYKHFLYSYLKDQPIWQSLRFWNAAFFDAVQGERARKPVVTRTDGSEARMDDREFQENITFGQLGTFTCNMRAFGLSKELCLEFLRKQSTIANLRDEQIQMLRENVERWTD